MNTNLLAEQPIQSRRPKNAIQIEFAMYDGSVYLIQIDYGAKPFFTLL